MIGSAGLLLINLGTPDDPSVSSVRKYLKEFLSDPRVITLPFLFRYLLLYLFILPFRPSRSAQYYRKIWTDKGSPLLHFSQSFTEKLQAQLGNSYTVQLGMRYGKPSISDALKALQHCDSLTILPLFPQYSSAATGSAIALTLQLLAQYQKFPKQMTVIREFYAHPAFIDAQVIQIQPFIASHDFLLFSYHGLPTKQILCEQSVDCCKLQKDCPSISSENDACYRAQCFATSITIASALGLTSTQYATAFQSRLGKLKWTQPYFEEFLDELYQRGVRRLAIACPGFVADCLETLEEIGIRAKKQWQQLGGEQLTLIPALNDAEHWVDRIPEIFML